MVTGFVVVMIGWSPRQNKTFRNITGITNPEMLMSSGPNTAKWILDKKNKWILDTNNKNGADWSNSCCKPKVSCAVGTGGGERIIEG